MKSNWTKRKIEYLSEKYGLTKEAVRRIIISEFKIASEEIDSADLENHYLPQVRLPLLGVFKEKRFINLDKKKKYLEKKRNRSLKLKNNVHLRQERTGDNQSEITTGPGVQKNL